MYVCFRALPQFSYSTNNQLKRVFCGERERDLCRRLYATEPQKEGARFEIDEIFLCSAFKIHLRFPAWITLLHKQKNNLVNFISRSFFLRFCGVLSAAQVPPSLHKTPFLNDCSQSRWTAHENKHTLQHFVFPKLVVLRPKLGQHTGCARQIVQTTTSKKVCRKNLDNDSYD